MSLVFYVIPYPVSRFPADSPVAYMVIDGRRPCPCPGACRHQVEHNFLRLARREALTRHQHECIAGGV
jgi:hypothetical protein